MLYEHVAHVLRSAAAISGSKEFFLVGSQAILMCAPNIPDTLLRSVEIDLWIEAPDEISDLVEGTLGEGSQFHHTYGYHVDVVGPTTARLPSGWKSRAIRMTSVPHFGGANVTSPSIPDLAASKLAAGRDKDREWVSDLVRSGGLSSSEIDAVIAEIEDDEARKIAETNRNIVFREGFDVPGW